VASELGSKWLRARGRVSSWAFVAKAGSSTGFSSSITASPVESRDSHPCSAKRLHHRESAAAARRCLGGAGSATVALHDRHWSDRQQGSRRALCAGGL